MGHGDGYWRTTILKDTTVKTITGTLVAIKCLYPAIDSKLTVTPLNADGTVDMANVFDIDGENARDFGTFNIVYKHGVRLQVSSNSNIPTFIILYA